jgi:hypothetical protein
MDVMVSVEKLTGSVKAFSLGMPDSGNNLVFNPELALAPGSWGYAILNIELLKKGNNTPYPGPDLNELSKKFGKITYANQEQIAPGTRIYVIKASGNKLKIMIYVTNLSGRLALRKTKIDLEKFNYAGNKPLLSQDEQLMASQQDSIVNLTWHVERPGSLCSVILEKSMDGIHYDALQEYPMETQSMNEAKSTDFNYSDQPGSNIVHYRLKWIMKNGWVSFSPELKINALESDNNYTPNPWAMAILDFITCRQNACLAHI